MARAPTTWLLQLYGPLGKDRAARCTEGDLQGLSFQGLSVHSGCTKRIWAPDARATSACVALGMARVQAKFQLAVQSALCIGVERWMACLVGVTPMIGVALLWRNGTSTHNKNNTRPACESA